MQPHKILRVGRKKRKKKRLAEEILKCDHMGKRILDQQKSFRGRKQ